MTCNGCGRQAFADELLKYEDFRLCEDCELSATALAINPRRLAVLLLVLTSKAGLVPVNNRSDLRSMDDV